MDLTLTNVDSARTIDVYWGNWLPAERVEHPESGHVLTYSYRPEELLDEYVDVQLVHAQGDEGQGRVHFVELPRP